LADVRVSSTCVEQATDLFVSLPVDSRSGSAHLRCGAVRTLPDHAKGVSAQDLGDLAFGQTGSMQRATGIGGVFVRARDAEKLRRWYSDHLGIDFEDWGGRQFDWTAGGSTTWSVTEADASYFGRPDQAAMINFRVADLDGMRAQLRAAGVRVADETTEHELGRFGWAYDVEGNRFELWQPPEGG
jgi:predicted enzyme related to lactoylglutathione lyase